MRNCFRIPLALVGLALFLPAAEGRLVINEVFYNVSPQGGNQFVELYNAGTNTVYLDGVILTDEASDGTEGVFKFPGSPGGTTLPVAPGAYVVIAVDATNATAGADWECYAGLTDTDNPAVPNLVIVSGSADLGLFSGGDNLILADGTDLTVPIDPLTVIDGMNFAGGGGELAPLGPSITDPNPFVYSPSGYSLGRCPDGADNNISSAAEFFPMPPTPGAPNICLQPTLNISSISITEGNSGAVTALVPVILFPAGSQAATVQFFTSNGTALAGSDYIATNGVLTFLPGVQTQFIRVVILSDTLSEPDETFTVRLINPTNATLGTAIASVTILDDDSAVPVSTSAFVFVSASLTVVTTRWESVSGAVYRLQASPTLLPAAWTNVGNIITAIAPITTAIDSNTTATTRFYRVLQLLP